MGTTAEKLSYLNGTKRLLRRRLNSLGANITLETTFRDYLLWLDRFYDAASSSVSLEILGETTQRATTQSANILPLYDDEIVTDGVTVTISDGGKIAINGTPTRDLYIKLTNGMEVEYETPTPNSGHRWYLEKVTEFNEETTINYQIGIGGGTQASTGNLICLNYHKTGNSPEGVQTAQIERFVNNYYQEKTIAATTVINKVTELNFAYIKLKSGELINTYGYIQASLTQEQNWVPNNDALPPSPDNHKRIINKQGNIIYTASDGTEFPVKLGGIGIYWIELAKIGDYKDRIYYKNGKFYLEKNIGMVYLDGDEDNWVESVSELGWNAFTLSYSVDTILNTNAYSNYFKCMPSLSDWRQLQNNQAFIGRNKRQMIFRNDSVSGLANWKTWLASDGVEVYYVLEEPVVTEITSLYYETLYEQLQAIVDYETKLKIQEKIGG